MRYLENKEEYDEFLQDNKDKLVVIDFTAAWCGPCKRIAPVFEELSGIHPNVAFAKVDVDNNTETAEGCKISAMPTFLFIKNGQQIDSITGANEAKLRELIEKHK